MNLMEMKLISCFINKKQHIDVYRDKHGKFFVRNGDIITQKRLTASEIVCYLSHIANDQV